MKIKFSLTSFLIPSFFQISRLSCWQSNMDGSCTLTKIHLFSSFPISRATSHGTSRISLNGGLNNSVKRAALDEVNSERAAKFSSPQNGWRIGSIGALNILVVRETFGSSCRLSVFLICQCFFHRRPYLKNYSNSPQFGAGSSQGSSCPPRERD